MVSTRRSTGSLSSNNNNNSSSSSHNTTTTVGNSKRPPESSSPAPEDKPLSPKRSKVGNGVVEESSVGISGNSKEMCVSPPVSPMVEPQEGGAEAIVDSIKVDDDVAAPDAPVSSPVPNMEAAYVSGHVTETGQIITTTVGGWNGQSKQTVSYMAERVVGTGSFGVVFQAKCLETREQVAIKKVLQDKRYKNRKLQVMHLLHHSNVVQLKHFFYSTTEKYEVYLNLVLEYVPETIYRVLKNYHKMSQHMRMICEQLYAYQVIEVQIHLRTCS